MAPETLRKPAVYTTNSDIWAFGVMAYEVYCGMVWCGDDDNQPSTVGNYDGKLNSSNREPTVTLPY